MELTIIIPAYNAEPYIDELIQRLRPQIREGIEVIVVDDGSEMPYIAPYDWVKVIRQKNKGLAGARNRGLKEAKGNIIAFIDADDLVSENYVDNILDKTGDWDYMDLSWRSLEDLRFNYLLRSENDKLTNPSVCTRVFKREFIGDIRFNEKKDVAEDEDFTRRLDLGRGKRAVITEYMYYYRISTPNSLSKKYREGTTKTKRIVYYLPMITDKDTALLEEVKSECETNEVVILTNNNRMPELEKYALITRPIQTWADEARGVSNGRPNKYTYIRERSKPMKTQVVIYTDNTYKIGGIESFIYNFCKTMSKHYDIAVVYGTTMDSTQIARLLPMVPVVKNQPERLIECDTLIVNRIFDKIPGNIKAKQTIQMVHGCKAANPWTIPTDKGQIVCVSNAVRDSFGEDAKDATVIKNLVAQRETKEMLLLVSATRLDTNEKGQARMLKLAEIMEAQGVPFIWLYFSNADLKNAPANMVRMNPTLDILQYIRKADYLVQLSDTEAFCYSIVEALTEGTAVITTPLPVLKEIGVKKENSYIVPFDLEGVDATQFLNVPEFKYTYNNGLIVSKWKKLIGNTKPTGAYKPEDMATVKILQTYNDIELGRKLEQGERVAMGKDRAMRVQEAGFGRIEEG